jgi:hypothetical protein
MTQGREHTPDNRLTGWKRRHPAAHTVEPSTERHEIMGQTRNLPILNRAGRRRLHDPVLDRMARIAHALDARMGQAQEPLTPQTQQLNVPTSAVASGTGTATFTFQAPPQGVTWTGTLTCAGAPGTSTFLATIGATSWGDWAGNSVYGPVQALANEQLVVTASGLTPSASYELVWAGSSDAAQSVQPVWPDTNTSALFASITAAPPGLVAGPGLSALVSASAIVPIPTTARTLILQLSSGPVADGLSTVKVTGTTSGIVYYNQAPYLTYQPIVGHPFYIVIVPVVGVVDSTVAVAANSSGGATNFSLTAWADGSQYDESVFYNGVAQSAQQILVGAGGATIINGPARLLTADLEASGNGCTGVIDLNSIGVLRRDGTAANPDPSGSLTFPPNTILPAGETLSLQQAGAGATIGSATFAYP